MNLVVAVYDVTDASKPKHVPLIDGNFSHRGGVRVQSMVKMREQVSLNKYCRILRGENRESQVNL